MRHSTTMRRQTWLASGSRWTSGVIDPAVDLRSLLWLMLLGSELRRDGEQLVTPPPLILKKPVKQLMIHTISSGLPGSLQVAVGAYKGNWGTFSEIRYFHQRSTGAPSSAFEDPFSMEYFVSNYQRLNALPSEISQCTVLSAKLFCLVTFHMTSVNGNSALLNITWQIYIMWCQMTNYRTRGSLFQCRHQL